MRHDTTDLSALVADLTAQIQQAAATADRIARTIADPSPQPGLVTVREACRLLSVSRSTLYTWRDRWEADTAAGRPRPRGIQFRRPAGSAMPRIARADIDAIMRGLDD